MDTAQKVLKLLDRIGLGDVPFQATQHGPFALVPLGDKILAVYEDASHDDQIQLYHQYMELADPAVYLITCTPIQFLALIATNNLYGGFHDHMAWAIKLPMLYKSPLFGMRKPNYSRISRVLEAAGFEGI